MSNTKQRKCLENFLSRFVYFLFSPWLTSDPPIFQFISLNQVIKHMIEFK